MKLNKALDGRHASEAERDRASRTRAIIFENTSAKKCKIIKSKDGSEKIEYFDRIDELGQYITSKHSSSFSLELEDVESESQALHSLTQVLAKGGIHLMRAQKEPTLLHETFTKRLTLPFHDGQMDVHIIARSTREKTTDKQKRDLASEDRISLAFLHHSCLSDNRYGDDIAAEIKNIPWASEAIIFWDLIGASNMSPRLMEQMKYPSHVCSVVVMDDSEIQNNTSLPEGMNNGKDKTSAMKDWLDCNVLLVLRQNDVTVATDTETFVCAFPRSIQPHIFNGFFAATMALDKDVKKGVGEAINLSLEHNP